MTQVAITWRINDLERVVEDGYVYIARWAATGKPADALTGDDTNSVESLGVTTLERPASLLPYESLTEDLVISWVKEKLNEVPSRPEDLPEDAPWSPPKSELQRVEEHLISEVNKKLKPSISSGVPWPPKFQETYIPPNEPALIKE